MVKANTLQIVWDKLAKNQLNSAYKKILKESYQGAITVRDGIINTIETIPEHPFKYPPDKLKNNNTGNYRAFELYNYRIDSKITEEFIQIFKNPSRKKRTS